MPRRCGRRSAWTNAIRNAAGAPTAKPGRRGRGAKPTGTMRRGFWRCSRDSATEPVSMQVAPFAAQPGARGGDVAIVQFADQRVKGRTMIHVPQMRDLVRDGGAADMVGSPRQPPTVAKIAGRGATAPARSEEQ